jgi:hypothetical protein
MEDHEWMYTGHVGRNDVTSKWIRKIDDFVERAYDEAAKGASLARGANVPTGKENKKRPW